MPAMIPRPRAITIIAWIFIAAGSIGFLYHLSEFSTLAASARLEAAWVCLVRVLAVIGGGFMLRGFNWARWLLAAWMAYHVVLSIFHSPAELLMHVLLFGILGYFLYRSQTSAFFAGRRLRASRGEVGISQGRTE
jgi:hypothetical protein